MKCSRLVLVAILLVSALPVFARDLRGLDVVPADAVTVGVVRLSELRDSPLANRIFSQADRITVDGEADTFLREAGFNPFEDIDTVTFALAPGGTESVHGNMLLVLEGRFDPQRIGDAITARGAEQILGESGAYFRMEEASGALALVSPRLAVAGKESVVQAALAAIQRGGTDFANAGGIAHLLGKVDTSSSAWLIVDVPRASRYKGEGHFQGSSDRDRALNTAMKNVAVVGMWADERGSELNLGATAISNDAETLTLLEDLLRGMLASWRLVAQDRAPELVAEIRRFSVARSGNSITLSGELSAETIEKFTKRGRRAAAK